MTKKTITEKALKEMINNAVAKKLKEAVGEDKNEGTVVPDAKKIVEFTKKFDDLLTKMIVDIRELADEGEGLMRENLLNHPEVGTRNELIIQKVGLLRAMANSISTTWERVRRYMP